MSVMSSLSGDPTHCVGEAVDFFFFASIIERKGRPDRGFHAEAAK